MSCSLWRWTTECENRPCIGDCDYCSYNMDDDDEPKVVYWTDSPQYKAEKEKWSHLDDDL